MSARNLNKFGKQVNLAGFTPENVFKAVPSLALWGGSAVAGVLLYTQGVKKVRNDVLESIPFISDYFKSTHEVPASDNPF
ncbi:glucosyltransferase [Savitreella phatthalungensis]